MTGLIRFHEQEPQQQEVAVPVEAPLHVREEVQVHRMLRRWRLGLTDTPGTYFYADDAGRSGWLRLEGFSAGTVATVHQLVSADVLSAQAGVAESMAEDDWVGSYTTARTGNPYLLVAVGVAMMVLGAAGLARMAPLAGQGTGNLVATVMMGLLVLVGVLPIVRGAVRLTWWHRARAEARRRGVPLPDKLKGLGL